MGRRRGRFQYYMENLDTSKPQKKVRFQQVMTTIRSFTKQISWGRIFQTGESEGKYSEMATCFKSSLTAKCGECGCSECIRGREDPL